MTGFPDFWKQKEKKPGKSVWLWLGMFVLFAVVVLFGQSALVPPVPTPTPTAVAEIPADDAAAPSDSFLPDYQSTLDPNVAALEADNRSFLQIGIDMAVKLAIVIALVYGLLLGLRWLQQFKNPVKTGGATIQVLETIGLAPGRSLHLIVVGEKTLLLGSTEQNIALLTELADAHIPLPDEDLIAADEPASFEAALTRTAAPVETPVPTDAWQATLSSLRHNVQEMRDVMEVE